MIDGAGESRLKSTRSAKRRDGETPELREIAPNHFASCHRADELALDGVIEGRTLER